MKIQKEKRRYQSKRIVLFVLVFSFVYLITGCGFSKTGDQISMTQTENEADGLDEKTKYNQTSQSFEAEAKKEESTQSDAKSDSLENADSQKIKVYVCGAVKKSGVYELDSSARMIDAITCAGGFSKKADQQQLNLAECIQDGQKIYVPKYGEKNASQADNSNFQNDEQTQTNKNSSGKININGASEQELTSLPGIGEAKAKAIIAYREEHGGFQTIEDIKNITGIKDAVFIKIKEYITVG